ncbi:MAG TPA: ABC transporter permease [Acidisoma sp.]|jgi:ribose transport system permease protein|nr:ABC transporter permease [Acidisoma sp.]
MTTLETARPVPATDDRGMSRRRLDGEVWTVIALFAITIVMILASRLISPSFGSWEQARAILILTSFVMVIAFGQQSVILLGGLDLSVGSMMTLGGILTFSWIGASGPALVWGIPAVLIVTALIGAANGIGVTVFRVPPFIMTLAMGIIIYSAALGITGGTPSGQSAPLLGALFTHSILSIPWVIILMAVVALFGGLLQQATPFGRRLYAIGTSPQAALIAGIPVRRIVILTYAISGAAAGFAGVLMVGYSGGATLTMGDSYLLPSIAAVVIGGTSIVGGRGLYLGAIGGAFLLTTLSTVIASIGIAQGWRTIIYGLVILFALVLLRDELSVWIVRVKTGGRP